MHWSVNQYYLTVFRHELQIPPSRPSSGEAFPLDVVALLVDFADRLAFDPALMKGYGKDPALNGILASLWGFSADRHWSPDFYRVLGNNRIRYRL